MYACACRCGGSPSDQLGSLFNELFFCCCCFVFIPTFVLFCSHQTVLITARFVQLRDTLLLPQPLRITLYVQWKRKLAQAPCALCIARSGLHDIACRLFAIVQSYFLCIKRCNQPIVVVRSLKIVVNRIDATLLFNTLAGLKAARGRSICMQNLIQVHVQTHVN